MTKRSTITRPAVSSRIAGFYKKSLAQRQAHIQDSGLLSSEGVAWLEGGGGLDIAVADRMSENVIAVAGLPLGLALDFRINHRDHLVPMAVEEPSVIAAASNAARLVRIAGGFIGRASPPVMTAQIQLDSVPEATHAGRRLASHAAEILSTGDRAIPRMVERGGGCRDLEVRVLDPDSGLVVVHVYIDVGDAMGANTVDTVAEAVAPVIQRIIGGLVGLRILSNLPLRRMVTVTGSVSDDAIGGSELADGIIRASRFADLDPLRAATHNKSIMNGIDAVAVAVGQDWRSIEAGAHAYAAMTGRYRPLATWTREAPARDDAGELAHTASRRDDTASQDRVQDSAMSQLHGTITMPMAVGTVGGAVGVNGCARAGLELLGVQTAGELAVVMAAAGLASNLAALEALAGEGIQRGHMRLHRRRLERSECRAPGRDATSEGSFE